MGKTKELYMQYVQLGEDIERGYLTSDMIAKAWLEEEYEKLKCSKEMNEPLNTKITISDGTTTRIQIGEEALLFDK